MGQVDFLIHLSHAAWGRCLERRDLLSAC